MYRLLTGKLRQSVRNDIALVSKYANWTTPLAISYVSDAALRQDAAEAIRQLPPDQIQLFSRMVRRVMRNN